MRAIYERARAVRLGADLPWFDEPWSVNLLIVRSGRVGQWDDRAVLACVDDAGRSVVQLARVSAEAWPGEWESPTHPDGCPYILHGHYPSGYVLGEHKGRPALRQAREFRYVRWTEGRVPTVAELEHLGSTGGDFRDILGTHWHNQFDHRAPEGMREDTSVGCIVSLWRHQHAAAMELVRCQQAASGSAVVSPTFLSRSAWIAACPGAVHPDV